MIRYERKTIEQGYLENSTYNSDNDNTYIMKPDNY